MTSEPGLRTLQVTGTVRVELAALHEAPTGTGPSPTVNVSVTTPGAVHVNVVFAEFAAENVPLAADHAYVRPARSGADAIAERVTVPPMTVCCGLAETLLATAQLDRDALIAAEPASGAVALHKSAIVTPVVMRLAMAKVAEPPQVTWPSVVVPETEIV